MLLLSSRLTVINRSLTKAQFYCVCVCVVLLRIAKHCIIAGKGCNRIALHRPTPYHLTVPGEVKPNESLIPCSPFSTCKRYCSFQGGREATGNVK